MPMRTNAPEPGRARPRSVKTYPRRAVTAEGSSRRDSLFVVFFPVQNLGKTWVKNPPFLPPFSPFLSTKPSEIIGTSA